MSLQPYAYFCKGLQILLPMMNFTALTQKRNRLLILVVALLGIVIAVSLTFVWPTPAVATDESAPSAEPTLHRYALNIKQSKVDEKNEQLSSLLTRAAIVYKLRDTLTKYGVPPEDEVKVSLAMKDMEATSYIEAASFTLMKGNSSFDLEPIHKSFRDALIDDFLTPADVSYGLIDKFLELHGIPNPEVVGLRLTLESMFKSDMLNDMPQLSIDFFSYCLRPPACPTLWCPYP